MPLLLVLLLALIGPRIAIVLLWLLTSWFSGMFASLLWPILGFIFMPYTLLWFSIVQNLFGGVWGPLSLVGLVLSALVDLSSSGYGYRRYHGHDVIVVDDAI